MRNDDHFQQFALLSEAIFILLMESISEHLQYAAKPLLHFYFMFYALDRDRYETANVHLLVHLLDNVRNLQKAFNTVDHTIMIKKPKTMEIYVKSKQNNLVFLTVGESTLTDDYSIVCSMNSYFSSVFTVEDYANLPVLNYIVDEQLENIYCSTSEVVKHLQHSNQTSLLGPITFRRTFFKFVQMN